MNGRMKNGSSSREHVLKMINHLNEAKINGPQIDEKTQDGMIIETLSPDFLLKVKKQGKSDLLVMETCLVENDFSTWIVDSGASNHVCTSLQMLETSKDLEEGSFQMRVGNGARILVTKVGIV